MWLNKGVIDGEDTALDAMYAYLAFYHADRISVSIASNRRKMALIRQGMWVGLTAASLFAASLMKSAWA